MGAVQKEVDTCIEVKEEWRTGHRELDFKSQFAGSHIKAATSMGAVQKEVDTCIEVKEGWRTGHRELDFKSQFAGSHIKAATIIMGYIVTLHVAY
ncbi:hypothetical protein V498_02248 [Pseudogymnoascus sp. VKM F-4517 (FW-2822)]|nr:hypothetical protein V498_02248 [Pseudogymnoascus sp. VKM F-4517 (FW-2822)]